MTLNKIVTALTMLVIISVTVYVLIWGFKDMK